MELIDLRLIRGLMMAIFCQWARQSLFTGKVSDWCNLTAREMRIGEVAQFRANLCLFYQMEFIALLQFRKAKKTRVAFIWEDITGWSLPQHKITFSAPVAVICLSLGYWRQGLPVFSSG
jgi:accessory colonization factor AcfC